MQAVKIRFCPLADKWHREEWRLFAHMGHEPDRICWARAAEEELTDAEISGICFHEIGHIVAEHIGMPEHRRRRRRKGDRTPQEVQDEADAMVQQLMGWPLQYNRRTLQEIPMTPFSSR